MKANQETARLLRFFQNRADVRPEVVRQIGVEQGRVTEALTAAEMVAVALIWCARRPMAEVVQGLAASIEEGWFERIEPESYPYVEATAGELGRLGRQPRASRLAVTGCPGWESGRLF